MLITHITCMDFANYIITHSWLQKSITTLIKLVVYIKKNYVGFNGTCSGLLSG